MEHGIVSGGPAKWRRGIREATEHRDRQRAPAGKRFKPLPQAKIDTRIESLECPKSVASHPDAARRLYALSNARNVRAHIATCGTSTIATGSFSVPFTILAFHEHDLVCQAFQSDEEDWMNGGEQQSPAFAAAIDPKDPESIKAGFVEFRHSLRMLEAFGELLAILPGCDVLEEQK